MAELLERDDVIVLTVADDVILEFCYADFMPYFPSRYSILTQIITLRIIIK